MNQAARERAIATVKKTKGYEAKEYADMRAMFDSKDIDAVSIATPNHWHALATIWACQAGKDVYVEKPACHNIYEGQQMVKAARKYNRMVQVGSQSRSMPHKMKAIQLLHEGAIGKVYMRAASASAADSRSDISRTNPFRPGSTGTSSSDRRRCSHTTRTSSPTTGIGSGTPATATSAIRACTRWTLRSGDLRKSGMAGDGGLDRRQIRLERRPGDAEHAAGHLRLRRCAS